MASDQVSAGNTGEPGFGFGSLLLRLLFALLIVLLTFNPSGFSFLHWAKDAFLSSSLGPLHFLAGIVLLIGWVVFVQATVQSLGMPGIALVAVLFGVLVWMLFFYDVVKTSSTSTITWIVLIGVSVVLTIGVSWAHIRRRLSGQSTVDEIND